jgi:hypothetical protein
VGIKIVETHLSVLHTLAATLLNVGKIIFSRKIGKVNPK